MEGDPQRSRWWELEHSWWLVLIALSFGFLTWVAFGYIWLRTRVGQRGEAAELALENPTLAREAGIGRTPTPSADWST